jgi:hypothetical protein
MNLIMISRRPPDYLHDMLYYGFKSLGFKVKDLPRKPNLHTEEKGLLSFNYNEDEFESCDVLLVCEYPQHFDGDLFSYVSEIKSKYNPKKIAHIDGSDRPEDFPLEFKEPNTLLFRRELKQREEGIINLPFAALPEDPILNVKKDIDVLFSSSYSGQPFRLEVERRLHALKQEGLVIYNSLEPVNREEYLSLLNRSKIVISTRGFGDDCYRYWETPRLGAVMLSEDIPIDFENDFIDGESCFKFRLGDSEHMVSRIKEILDMPEKGRNRVSLRALQRSLRFHKPEDRASYVLSKVLGL